MFTGLIEDLGEVKRIAKTGKGISLVISTQLDMKDFKKGESIAVNGVCLTLVTLTPQGFKVEVSPETIKRTNLGDLKEGDHVNLERALKLNDRLGGHLVTGHVDATGTLIGRHQDGNFCQMVFTAPQEVMKFVIEKGSIAVDGISLTVNRCSKQDFTITIIPYTLKHTNLGERKLGDKVNLEADLIGKYVEKFVNSNREKGINRQLLAEYGFI